MKQGTASIGSRSSSGSIIGPAMPLAPSSTTRMSLIADGIDERQRLVGEPVVDVALAALAGALRLGQRAGHGQPLDVAQAGVAADRLGAAAHHLHAVVLAAGCARR